MFSGGNERLVVEKICSLAKQLSPQNPTTKNTDSTKGVGRWTEIASRSGLKEPANQKTLEFSPAMVGISKISLQHIDFFRRHFWKLFWASKAP